MSFKSMQEPYPDPKVQQRRIWMREKIVHVRTISFKGLIKRDLIARNLLSMVGKTSL
jgi:hypothetical protein